MMAVFVWICRARAARVCSTCYFFGGTHSSDFKYVTAGSRQLYMNYLQTKLFLRNKRKRSPAAWALSLCRAGSSYHLSSRGWRTGSPLGCQGARAKQSMNERCRSTPRLSHEPDLFLFRWRDFLFGRQESVWRKERH